MLPLALEHRDHRHRVVALDEAAGVLGEREPGVEIDLALAGPPAQLRDELDDLQDAGRADRDGRARAGRRRC